MNPLPLQMINEILAMICLLIGVGFVLTAGIGLVRLPDVLCRSHAVAKAMTLGVILLLLGLWLTLGEVEKPSGLKILLAVFFQFLTIPVASHLLSLMAWEQRLPRWRERPPDGPWEANPSTLPRSE